MYPFWDPVVAPLVAISEARRIVEIGALRGETTVKMLEDLGEGAELHVIDPLPQFDPGEHERRFPGQYIFHRDLSLNVLPDAPAFDVALIDGDHNWYTVYHELQHIRNSSRAEGRPLPLLILHDVGWPYGRRDLYYAPWQIPEEFRQPHEQRGMMPGRAELLRGGGMNITLDNAVMEGGERNGVRTAFDDFVAEHDSPIRQVVLPIYFGLAIAAEQAYLDEHPAVAAFLDELESHEGTRKLLELSEDIRLDEVVFAHNIERMNNDKFARATDRYVSLLRASLLDEHYIDNETRIDYLLDCIERGEAVDPETLRAPAKRLAPSTRRISHGKDAGPPSKSGHFPYTDMGRLRLEQLDEGLRLAMDNTDTGDFVEVGVGRGGGGIYMRGLLDALEVPDRNVWVVDEFRADIGNGDLSNGTAALRTDLNQVRDGFDRFDLLDDRVKFLKGQPADALTDAGIGMIAALRIGSSVNAADVLELLYDHVLPGGVVMIEAATDEDRANVEAFRSSRGIIEADRVGWSGLGWQKIEPAPDAPAESTGFIGRTAPLAGPRKKSNIDLSIVVVFYNMRREAERTLHSLSRSYQRELGDLNFEVIAVENGSDADQRLGREFVESFGPEFRYINVGKDALPSPTHALNRGIQASKGKTIGLMIDGAHVLSPGVFSHAMSAFEAYGPAVVLTQQWYVGPGQQPDAVAKGYNQAREDELFATISWPSDGYRLFNISHFIGERDWLDGILESNCIFAERALLEQVGGFDDTFDMPGAGYANLELFERLGSHPDTKLTTILGEGSFHQVHGGTTTNDAQQDDRRNKTFSYGEHYEENFGRPMQGPAKLMHYVGSFNNMAARRTRARRLSAMGLTKGRVLEGPDAVPTEAHQMPDELVTSFTDAFWHSLEWQNASWLGEPTGHAPTDLFAYQAMLSEIRPDNIIVTSDESLGLARYLATVCDLLDHGTVTVIGDKLPAESDHGRIRIIASSSDDPGHDAVRAALGDDPHAFVVLGAAHNAARIKQDFAAYAPMVRAGSYVIVENTIFNGRPVWPGYGPGPFEAVTQILPVNGDFIADTEVERFGLTFNPGGFLRRVR